jgi:hypothetical protein
MSQKTAFFIVTAVKTSNPTNAVVPILSPAMVLGSTQSLTEISTRDLLGAKDRPARKADNLTAIRESII